MDIEDISLNVYKSTNYNILIIGDSRSGKTTFIEYLKNINYIVKSEVFRGTIEPCSDTLFLKYGSENMHINFIDTPGFNEMSDTSSRTNTSLKALITSFVKKDITKLNMILIAINGVSGMTFNQVESVTNTIRFLGRDLVDNVVVLVTHFDLKDYNSEEQWKQTFKQNQNVRFISMIVKDRYLFTGAIDEAIQRNVMMRDQFIRLQQKRLHRFIDLMITLHPNLLSTETDKFAKSMFTVSESIIKDYYQIKDLSPLVVETNKLVINKRVYLSELIQNKLNNGIKEENLQEYIQIVEQSSQIGTNNFVIPDFDANLEQDIKNYMKISN